MVQTTVHEPVWENKLCLSALLGMQRKAGLTVLPQFGGPTNTVITLGFAANFVTNLFCSATRLKKEGSCGVTVGASPPC